MKTSDSLIGIICIDIKEGFIIKKNYFANFNFSQNILELSASENISILSDNEIKDIASDSKNIVITLKKYIYLFSFDSVWKYKKIKFELSSKYEIDKVSIFTNYISIIGKEVSYPYTKALYVLYFEYEANTEVLYYKTTSKIYKLNDNQMQVECNYCFSLLKISKYNSTICAFISDINSKSIIALSITTKRQSELSLSYLTNIYLNLPTKSSSFIFSFIGDIIFFSDNNSNIYICEQSYRCNSTMTSLEIKGSSITTINQNYNSISLAILNESKKYIYLLIITINRIKLDISIDNKLNSNRIGFIEYSDALCANSSEINTLFIFETNSLFLWSSRIKTDYECSSSYFIKTTFCSLTQYYKRSVDKCIECDGNLISYGIQSNYCEKCDINNFCPKYCDEYLDKYGKDCDNCVTYIKKNVNMSGLSNGEVCEVDCGRGNLWTGDKCEEEIIFSGDNNLKKEEDYCQVKTSCYECYYDTRCVWCENLAQCMMASKELNCNKENAIKVKEMFDFIPYQYQCINPEKDLKEIKGKKKIIIELDTENELIKENVKIYKIYYSSVKDIKIDVSEFDTNIIIDISLINSLDHPLTAISISPSESINLSTHLFYILITYTQISPIIITINSSSLSLTTIQIIAIVISIVAFIIIVLFIVVFVLKRKKSIQSNSLKLEQPKIRKTNSSKSSLPLSQNSIEISFTNTLKSSSDKEILITNKLKHLPIFYIDSSHTVFTNYICVFCKEKFIVNNKVCILPCDHIYHYKCLFNQMINIGKIRCIGCGNKIIN